MRFYAFHQQSKEAGRCSLVLIDTNIIKDGANWLTNTDMRRLVFRTYDKRTQWKI